MLSDMMTFAGPLWRGHAGDMTLDAGALLNATSTLVLAAPAPEHVHTPVATITTPAPQIRSQLTCLVCWSPPRAFVKDGGPAEKINLLLENASTACPCGLAASLGM